ncbi:hypothetical protein JL722_4204 [Aureococcus anophagefferens]|nr:hypothetical protein JL722_4204 [Aureococcus anophagefferens]
MLQASSSAPSLAASPYASTMSAESAMLLREIDSLEWMIDGVCFEYTPWDRRRSVAKAPGARVVVAEGVRALIDIFGGERGTIDSSDFAVFYKELGSIEKVRKTIARHYRNCSVVVTRKRREYRSMVVPLPPLSRPGTGSERPSRVSTAERGGRSSFDASDRASKLSPRIWTAPTDRAAAVRAPEGPQRVLRDHPSAGTFWEFKLFHVHLTHEEERALGNRFSSHSGDFVDCNALQDQFLQLARDGLREDRVGKSAGSNKKSDGPEEAQDVKARKAVDLMFGSESSFEDEEESMEELMSTLRKEIEDNLKERGVNKYAELNQHTTSNLVLTNLKRAKIQAREKQLTKDLNKYVRKVSDDIMSQWSQERAGSDPGRLVGDVQLALAALNGDDDEAETADLERSSILIHLKNAVSDKALKARFETISDELERERGLAMIDAWKDFGVLPMVTMAVVRERLRDNPDELRNVAARAAKIEELQSKKRSIQVEKAVRRIQNAWRAKVKANRERRIYGRRDLAALTLQSMWHRHCGKKLERQAELQGHELKKIGAIITIQAWFQRATARRHIRQLQRIRKRQRDHTMARKIQLRVRIVLSRFVLRAKKRDRKLEIYTSANTLQNKWRSRQQRKRWLEGLRQYKASTKIAAAMRLYLVAHLSPVVLGPIVLPKVLKHMNLAAPLVVEVHRCASLRSTDSALHAGTPSVFVTAYQQIEVELDDKPQLEQKPPAKEEESGARAPRLGRARRALQLEKTRPLHAGASNSPARGKKKQRVTSTFTPGTHTMENIRLPLGVMRREVEVERGKLLHLKNRERLATGELYTTIRPAPSAYSVEPRFEINCEHIIGVGYDVEDDTINVKVVGDKDYSFRIIVNEHKENDEDRGFIRRTWLRKLRRVCPKIVTNEFCQEEMSHDAFVQQGDLAATPVPMACCAANMTAHACRACVVAEGCVKVDDAPSRAGRPLDPDPAARPRACWPADGSAFDGGEAYWLNIADVEAERFNQPQFIHIAKTGGSDAALRAKGAPAGRPKLARLELLTNETTAKQRRRIRRMCNVSDDALRSVLWR